MSPVAFKSSRTAKRRGFTLVEILAVVTIIAILTTITLGVAKSVSSRQALARANADMAAIAGGLELYKQTYGDYICTTGNNANPSNMATSSNFERVLLRALMGNYGIILSPGTTSAQTFSTTSINAYVSRRAFVAPESFRYSNGTSTYSGNNTSLSIVDPWNNPYVYRYKQNCRARTVSGNVYWFSDWVSPSFLLMCIGPDGTSTAARQPSANFSGSMSTTGIIPENYFTSSTYSMDNIIYGHAH